MRRKGKKEQKKQKKGKRGMAIRKRGIKKRKEELRRKFLSGEGGIDKRKGKEGL